MAMNAEDELQWLVKARGGDLDAFERIVQQYMQRLRMFLALRAPVYDLVDEVAQQTFIFAYEHLADFEPGTAFFSWLAAIAANILRGEVRRYARDLANRERLVERHLLATEETDRPRHAAGYLEYLDLCLQRVPEPLRRVLGLKYEQGCTAEEISRLERRTVAWVHTTLCRLRQQLRLCLERRAAADTP